MLKIGIVSSAYFHYDDFPEGLIDMASDGYDCCDYHGFIHEDSPLYKYSEEQLKNYLLELSNKAQESKIFINQLHAQWPLKAGSQHEIVCSLDRIKTSIRGAWYLMCPNIVIHPIVPLGRGEDFDEHVIFNKNVDFFTRVADYAEQYQVTICIENLPFVEFAISKVDNVLKLIKAVNKKNCKMCFDVGHAFVFKDDIGDDIIKIGNNLQVLHVHDNKGNYDSHMIPWLGAINWEAFSLALKRIDFQGCISLETYIENDMPQPMKSCMRKLLSKIARYISQ